MTRLPLPQVTLVAIDTRAPGLALQSLLRSMSGVQFGRVILFTHDWLPRQVLPELEVIDIPRIESGAGYSEFVLRHLPAYIGTSHVLVTQWDGFVVHPGAWLDEFLVHDYIGPVWHDQPAGCNVGNGGFSLRSRRLLAAGRDARITELHPEDAMLCRHHRDLLERVHGVRFAPAALARHFAFENESPGGPTFGFHGPFNLPRFLDAATVAEWLTHLPDGFFRGRDARRLARALLQAGMPRVAATVLHRRAAAGRDDFNNKALGLAARLLAPFKPG